MVVVAGGERPRLNPAKGASVSGPELGHSKSTSYAVGPGCRYQLFTRLARCTCAAYSPGVARPHSKCTWSQIIVKEAVSWGFRTRCPSP